MASPPPFSFILCSARSVFPSSMSCFVNRTLLWCSFFLVLHLRHVSPVYVYLSHLQGMLLTTFEFLSPSGVFTVWSLSHELWNPLCWLFGICVVLLSSWICRWMLGCWACIEFFGWCSLLRHRLLFLVSSPSVILVLRSRSICFRWKPVLNDSVLFPRIPQKYGYPEIC